MIPYKDTFAAKGSALAAAIEKSPADAKKVYDQTTIRYMAMHSPADRAWFAAKWKEAA